MKKKKIEDILTQCSILKNNINKLESFFEIFLAEHIIKKRYYCLEKDLMLREDAEDIIIYGISMPFIEVNTVFNKYIIDINNEVFKKEGGYWILIKRL
jgi:hypothetical protein